jgi:hypothetical protein
MPRPERAAYAVAGAAMSALLGGTRPLVVAVTLVAIASNVGAVLRFSWLATRGANAERSVMSRPG